MSNQKKQQQQQQQRMMLRPVAVFPPTPEDETSLADLQPSADKFKQSEQCEQTPQSAWTLDASTGPQRTSMVETPTWPSSYVALSRFEFEHGKGNDGTKVLLVEWDSAALPLPIPDATDAASSAAAARLWEWSIAWEGKANYNVLAVRDTSSNTVDKDSTVLRVYFLLPPGAQIPHLVTILYTRVASKDQSGRDDADPGNDPGGDQGEEPVELWTKPMPAIYPASLDPSGGGGGDGGGATSRLGVLHTLWAKQRLADLTAEIESEMKVNSESIGLQIALQEHDWIVDHFAVGEPSGTSASHHYLPSPESPMARQANPRSPVGGRLGEKLKGLKLATSPADLAAASQARKAAAMRASSSAHASHPPRSAAVLGVLGTLVGTHTAVDAAAVAPRSLDAVIQGTDAAAAGTTATDGGADGEDELFALPLSPRSPEMARSPFSIL